MELRAQQSQCPAPRGFTSRAEAPTWTHAFSAGSIGSIGAATAGATALVGILWSRLVTLFWVVLKYVGAAYLSMRYFTGPTCWLLYGYMLWSEPILRLPLLLYQMWLFSPPGRRATANSRMPWLWRHNPMYLGLLRWFPGSSIVRTAPLDPSRKYVFAGHPHGVLGNAYFLAFCTELLGFSRLFPGIRLSVGVLSLNMRVAFCREIALALGLCDVDKPTLLTRLRQGPGSAVFLAVGGAAESLLTEKGRMDLILKRRKGFVRVALQAGADIVPVIAFGENDQFNRVHLAPGGFAEKLEALNKKICGFVKPWGYGLGVMSQSWGLLPEHARLTIVTGAPLRLPEFRGDVRSPEGQALVDEWHERYCTALRELWDAHKEEYAPDRKAEMEFVE